MVQSVVVRTGLFTVYWSSSFTCSWSIFPKPSLGHVSFSSKTHKYFLIYFLKLFSYFFIVYVFAVFWNKWLLKICLVRNYLEMTKSWSELPTRLLSNSVWPPNWLLLIEGHSNRAHISKSSFYQGFMAPPGGLKVSITNSLGPIVVFHWSETHLFALDTFCIEIFRFVKFWPYENFHKCSIFFYIWVRVSHFIIIMRNKLLILLFASTCANFLDLVQSKTCPWVFCWSLNQYNQVWDGYLWVFRDEDTGAKCVDQCELTYIDCTLACSDSNCLMECGRDLTECVNGENIYEDFITKFSSKISHF